MAQARDPAPAASAEESKFPPRTEHRNAPNLESAKSLCLLAFSGVQRPEYSSDRGMDDLVDDPGDTFASRFLVSDHRTSAEPLWDTSECVPPISIAMDER
jgi:hypothetical protein